jgi:hypothetical protein
VFKSTILFLLSALATNAQNSLPIPLVRGEMQADSAGFVGRGVVRLRAVLGSLETYEATLHADGSFEFPAGHAGNLHVDRRDRFRRPAGARERRQFRPQQLCASARG